MLYLILTYLSCLRQMLLKKIKNCQNGINSFIMEAFNCYDYIRCSRYSAKYYSNKIPNLRKYINGSPTILLNNGKLYKKNMKKVKLDLSEFLMMCREQGYFDISSIQTAIFECNGKLTVLPLSTNRPVTPTDLNLFPEADSISIEIIMDGHIIDENLKRLGLDQNWLTKKLKEQNYHNSKEIFLGVCDNKKQLTLFAYN